MGEKEKGLGELSKQRSYKTKIPDWSCSPSISLVCYAAALIKNLGFEPGAAARGEGQTQALQRKFLVGWAISDAAARAAKP